MRGRARLAAPTAWADRVSQAGAERDCARNPLRPGRTSTRPHANVPASAAASAAVLKYNDAVLASTTWGAL